LENLRIRGHLVDLGIDGKIIEIDSKEILGVDVTGFIWHRMVKLHPCQHGSKPINSIKDGEERL
jgi:hypothetical protein